MKILFKELFKFVPNIERKILKPDLETFGICYGNYCNYRKTILMGKHSVDMFFKAITILQFCFKIPHLMQVNCRLLDHNLDLRIGMYSSGTKISISADTAHIISC